jgi:hypothetical protein
MTRSTKVHEELWFNKSARMQTEKAAEHIMDRLAPYLLQTPRTPEQIFWGIIRLIPQLLFLIVCNL